MRKIIKILVCALPIFILSGCEKGLGKYVYVEYFDVLDGKIWHTEVIIHTNRKCTKIDHFVNYEPTEFLSDTRRYHWCNYCVTDKQAEQLEKLIKDD